jgi:hypothetical protein
MLFTLLASLAFAGDGNANKADAGKGDIANRDSKQKVWTVEEMNAVLYGNKTWTITTPQLANPSTITFKKISETEGEMTFGNGRKLTLKYTISSTNVNIGNGNTCDMMVKFENPKPILDVCNKGTFQFVFHNDKQIYMEGNFEANYHFTAYSESHLKQMQKQRERNTFTLNAK